MGRLRIKTTECLYKDNDIGINEEIINGTNIKVMTADIFKELTAIKDSSAVTSEQVLLWAKTVEAKRSQTAMLERFMLKCIKAGITPVSCRPTEHY